MSKVKIFKYKEIPEKCSIYQQCVIDEEGQEYIKYLDHKNPEKDKYEIFHPNTESNDNNGIHLMCPCGCKSFNVYDLELYEVTIRCVACGTAYLSNAERENENKGEMR